MTDRELMQQALDALIETVRLAGEYGTHLIRNDKDAGHAYTTIEELRARLAQPEPDDGYCQACDGGSCTAKNGCVALDNPPPQREWQGLTDEEIGMLTVFDGLHHVEVPLLADFIRAIEAKLKEKNT